jgi:energy-coupling factor transporter transmembrane protein EcfT
VTLQESALTAIPAGGSRPRLGPAGYLWVFLGLLGLAALAPAELTPAAAGIALLTCGLVFRSGWCAWLRPRSLALIALLAAPQIFLLGEADRSLGGLAYSSLGAAAALAAGLRMAILLAAVSGFTGRVSVTELAGLMEGGGLRGLGFSLGVALNLLPALQTSALNAWAGLRMRGGLRRRPLRGLQLLLVTVAANALRRAEEIALAAEARGFSPERARPLPVTPGRWDRAAGVLAAALAALALAAAAGIGG